MRRFFVVFAGILALSCPTTKLEAQIQIEPVEMRITQRLPWLATGDSVWDSVVYVSNLSSDPNTVTLEVFGPTGERMILETLTHGSSDIFTINLAGGGSTIIRSSRGGPMKVGWIKAIGVLPFGASLDFRLFDPWSDLPKVKASVFSAPAKLVNHFSLAPDNGMALLNPGTADATVRFFPRDQNGNEIRLSANDEIDRQMKTFTLKKGHTMAQFFREAPFSLTNQIGDIIISSNVPLSAIALGFDGQAFSTLPSLPAPRRNDLKKLGVVYLCAEGIGRACLTPQYVAERANEVFGLFQTVVLDRELPLNGFESAELPIDRDANGLPKVIVINGGARGQYLSFDGFDADVGAILAKVRQHLPSEWKYYMIIHDLWIPTESGCLPLTARGGGVMTLISAYDVLFWKQSYFGNKSTILNTPLPEFGNQPTPCQRNHHNTQTLETKTEMTLSVSVHEWGHAFGAVHEALPKFVNYPINLSPYPFASFMGPASDQGCFSSTLPQECILLPRSARSIFQRTRFYSEDWMSQFEEQYSPDDFQVTILSREVVGDHLRVTVRAESPTGISSIGLNRETGFARPFTIAWKELGHLDNLSEIVIEGNLLGEPPEKAYVTIEAPIFGLRWFNIF